MNEKQHNNQDVVLITNPYATEYCNDCRHNMPDGECFAIKQQVEDVSVCLSYNPKVER